MDTKIARMKYEGWGGDMMGDTHDDTTCVMT